jgi:hypothetical protein
MHAGNSICNVSGIVKSNTGDVLPGAVMVVHKPTGSKIFTLRVMMVGGFRAVWEDLIL